MFQQGALPIINMAWQHWEAEKLLGMVDKRSKNINEN